ncbi:MAG: hypothetical protein IPJ13_21115 [Saprospiraceae bacterium]|nr:hypothetical protein [Saprospiraceae bacterium]
MKNRLHSHQKRIFNITKLSAPLPEHSSPWAVRHFPINADLSPEIQLAGRYIGAHTYYQAYHAAQESIRMLFLVNRAVFLPRKLGSSTDSSSSHHCEACRR